MRPSHILLLIATMTAMTVIARRPDSPNYGSYVTTCDTQTQEVTFINYEQQNCAGTSTNYSKPLNACKTELIFFSWNAFCNDTNMWYNNFDNLHCSGSSILTRMYTVGSCFNCPNPECKNP